MNKKKVLIGCGIGCTTLIVIMIVAVFAAIGWVNEKGEFDTASSILTDDAELFTRINLTSDNEVLVDFVLSLFENNQSAYNAGSPEYMQNIQSWKAEKDIRQFLPLELELTGLPHQKDFRASVGVAKNVNLVRLGFYFMKKGAAKEGKTYDHKDATVVIIDQNTSPLYGTYKDNIIYAASTREGLNASLDLVGITAEPGQDPRLTGIDTQAPVYGFLKGQATDLTWLEQFEEQGTVRIGNDEDGHREAGMPDETRKALSAFLKEADLVAFDMSFTGNDQVAGLIVIEHPQANQENAEHLSTLLDQWQPKLEVTTKVSLLDGAYHINYILSGFNQLSDSGHNQ